MKPILLLFGLVTMLLFTNCPTYNQSEESEVTFDEVDTTLDVSQVYLQMQIQDLNNRIQLSQIQLSNLKIDAKLPGQTIEDPNIKTETYGVDSTTH